MKLLRIEKLGDTGKIDVPEVIGTPQVAVQSLFALSVLMERFSSCSTRRFLFCWERRPKHLVLEEGDPSSEAWRFLVRHQPPLIQGWYSLSFRNISLLISYADQPPFYSDDLEWVGCGKPTAVSRLPPYFSLSKGISPSVIDIIGAGIA